MQEEYSHDVYSKLTELLPLVALTVSEITCGGEVA